MEGHPEILKAYKQAYQTHLDSVKSVGIGSLIWKIQESKLSSDEQIARIIIDPSSGPLLPDYIATVDEDDWASFKPFVLKSLIVDRKREKESNAVLIMHGLLCRGDKVAWNILTYDERLALLNASVDYQQAREVLTAYSIVPKKSESVALATNLKEDFLVFLVVEEMRQSFAFHEVPALKRLYKLIDNKEFISVLLWALRLKIWIDILRDNEGERHSAGIKSGVLKHLSRGKASDFESYLNYVNKVDDLRDETLENGPDFVLAAMLWRQYIPEDASEDEHVTRTNALSEILNYERVNMLHQYRFKLRYFNEYPPSGDGGAKLSIFQRLKGRKHNPLACDLELARARRILFEDCIES
jgi:hypothetical protein